MSTQAYINRRRILAIANNTKVQQPRNIAVNTSSIYSTINCNPNFKSISYLLKRSCIVACPTPPPPVNLSIPPCYSLPVMDGGNPSSIPTYFVNGGIPLSAPNCIINSTTPCYSLPTMNGGNPPSIPTYFINGGMPNSVPQCIINSTIPSYSLPTINGGPPSSIPTYFVNGGNPSSIPIWYVNQ